MEPTDMCSKENVITITVDDGTNKLLEVMAEFNNIQKEEVVLYFIDHGLKSIFSLSKERMERSENESDKL